MLEFYYFQGNYVVIFPPASKCSGLKSHFVIYKDSLFGKLIFGELEI